MNCTAEAKPTGSIAAGMAGSALPEKITLARPQKLARAPVPPGLRHAARENDRTALVGLTHEQ